MNLLRPQADRVIIAKLPHAVKIGVIHVPDALNTYHAHGNQVRGIALMVGVRAKVQTHIEPGDELLLHPHLVPTILNRYISAEQLSGWFETYRLPEGTQIISLYAGADMGRQQWSRRPDGTTVKNKKRNDIVHPGEIYGVIHERRAEV